MRDLFHPSGGHASFSTIEPKSKEKSDYCLTSNVLGSQIAFDTKPNTYLNA